MKRFFLIPILLLLLFSNILLAKADRDEVAKLYIATFNRAPDKAGLDYWVNDSGLSIEQIASSFFDQPETKKLYPEGSSDEFFVKSIYRNVFGREPDEAGLKYWVEQLKTMPRSVMLEAVKNGAIGKDAILMEQKLAKAKEFLETGSNDVKKAKEILKDIKLDTIFSGFKLKSLDIYLIGDYKDYRYKKIDVNKYATLLKNEDSINFDENNSDSPEVINRGKFYHIRTNFVTTKVYPMGLNFDFTIVSADRNSTYSKTIYSIKSKPITKIGEQSFEFATLFSSDIPKGKYIFIVNISDIDIEKLIDEKKSIDKIPQFGSFYVQIEDDGTSKRIEVLDVVAGKHIDLPYNPKFIDGHTNSKAGSFAIQFFNSSDRNETIKLSASLILEDGTSINLLLLDPKDGKIKESIAYSVKGNKDLDFGNIDTNRDINYYIPETDYTSLIAKLPNLMLQTDSDGLKGKIKISINQIGDGWGDGSTNALQISNNEIEFPVVLSKFVKNFIYTDIKPLLTPVDVTQLDIYSPQLQLTNNLKPITSSRALQLTDTKKIETNLSIVNNLTLSNVEGEVSNDTSKNLASGDNVNIITSNVSSLQTIDSTITLKTPIKSVIEQIGDSIFDISKAFPVDAALVNGDFAYIFSGNKVLTYKVSEKRFIPFAYPISSLFHGVTFDKIDACFKNGDFIFFFRNNKYTKYSISKKDISDDGLEVEAGESYPKNISQFGNGIPFSYLDASATDSGFAYLFKGNQYVKFDLNSYKVVGGIKNISDKWSGVSNPTAALSDYEGKGRITFFNNKKTTTKFLKDKLFKKENGFNVAVGDTSKIALTFNANYSLEGFWTIPGIDAKAYSDLKFHILSKSVKLLKIDAEGVAMINKIHPLADPSSLVSPKSRVGARLIITTLFGYELYKYDKIEEKTINTPLSNAIQDVSDKIQDMKNRFPNLPSYSKSWNEHKEIISQRFMVGPVPVKVAGGIDGSLGINAGIVFQGLGIKATASAPLALSLYFEGSVDAVVARAGVRGTADLVNTGGNASLGGELTASLDALSFDLKAKVDAYLKAIRASLSLFAGLHTKIEWCKSWGIPYPCGLGWYNWDYTLYQTPWLYDRSWTILDVTVPVLSLPLK